jgi:hypothetical protein
MTTSQAFIAHTTLPTPFAASVQKLALTGTRVQAQTLKSMMRYQIEALSFLKHRVEMDLKFLDDLVASDHLNDAFNVFSTFMQNAAYEYATEVSKVVSIGSKVASEAAVEVRKEAEEAVEDMLVAATA